MAAQFCEYTKNHSIVALNKWIVWYVSYISIKLLLKERGSLISHRAKFDMGNSDSDLIPFYEPSKMASIHFFNESPKDWLSNVFNIITVQISLYKTKMFTQLIRNYNFRF